MRFHAFFWDSNKWFGKIDSPERWFNMLTHVLRDEADLDRVLEAKMAPVAEISELPPEYFIGNMHVNDGELRSFGFRREHIPGTVKLEEWAKARGMDLRELSKQRPRA
jgi:hypothetical protein